MMYMQFHIDDRGGNRRGCCEVAPASPTVVASSLSSSDNNSIFDKMLVLVTGATAKRIPSQVMNKLEI